MPSPLEQCRELLMNMEDAEGRPLSVEDEERIDFLSEVIHPVVAPRVSEAGELDFPGVMPAVDAVVAEHIGDEGTPDSRIVYGAVLLAVATEREGRAMMEDF